MKTTKKYVMSGGLAFSEDSDMEKLRKYSLKGWHVSSFAFMGYQLRKGTSTDYIYNVDYRLLKEEENEEYFDFFSSTGWTHIASEGNVHLFRAFPDTPPIFSDRETIVDRHDHVVRSMKGFTIIFTVLTALVWLGSLLSTGVMQNILLIAAISLSVIAIPTIGTMLASYNNKRKAMGKKSFMKHLPALLIPITVFIFLVTANDSSNPVRLIAYMLLGAVTFPTVIWIIKSLYHRMNGKRV